MRAAVLFLVLVGLTPFGLAQRIQSFVNEDGVTVFTNAPVRQKLQTTGTPSAGRRSTDRAAPFRPIIREVSSRYGVDEYLVEAIIKVESNFDPEAISVKDCKGLMQLHPDTAKRFGVQDSFDPGENIEGGVRYLQFLLEEFDDDLELALAAYNAGENAVRRHQGVPPYRETRNYVKKLSTLYDFSYGGFAANAVPEPMTRVMRIARPDGSLHFTNTPTLE
jgi:soluble lytic murein transglycosylase-like protein